jgi:hypothetical protein
MAGGRTKPVRLSGPGIPPRRPLITSALPCPSRKDGTLCPVPDVSLTHYLVLIAASYLVIRMIISDHVHI